MSIMHGSGTINAQAQPGGAATDTITLSGTTGSPNNSLTIDDFFAYAEWRFKVNGTVNRYWLGISEQWQDGTEWNGSQDSPNEDWWIRVTVYSGNTPSGTLNSWLKISGSGSAERAWSLTQSGVGGKSCILKVEISPDSGGSTIEATGYYKIQVDVFDGGL